MEIAELTPGNVLTNEDIQGTFKVGNMGGMRRSKATNTLVLVSDHTKSLYHDRWIDGLFHYTGMGTTGDQRLDYSQNKTLNESDKNGVAVHLFEVFKKNKYVYQGQVEVTETPYTEQQLDANDIPRQVYVFPLSVIGSESTVVEEHMIEELFQKQLKKAKELSLQKLKSLVEGKRNATPNKRQTCSTSFDRDPYVVEYALRRANGICQLCDRNAPFNRKDGTLFLEVHHIEYLATGGPDTIDNVAALCPNCHRKMHVLENGKDKLKLVRLASVKLEDQ